MTFCTYLKEASPSHSPFLDTNDGLSPKPDIDALGSGWVGLREIPTKESCLALEREAVFGVQKDEIEEGDIVDIDLAVLQGIVKKDEPVGTTLDYENAISSATPIHNLGLVTSYPVLPKE